MSDPLPYESAEEDRTPVANRVCPKCGGAMVRGFVVDRGHLNVPAGPTTWSPGAPKVSFWKGLKLGKLVFSVDTFRCDACGFLESYATTAAQR